MDCDMVRRAEFDRFYLDSFELDELARRNYQKPLLAAQYIYSRIALKLLISRYLCITLPEISIRTTSEGAPFVLLEKRESRLFSVSFSHDNMRLFVAACFSHRCAVDIQSLAGIDWNLVMYAMGWSEKVRDLIIDGCTSNPIYQWSPNLICALVWCSYEVWMKLTFCRGLPSDFSWDKIHFLEKDPVSCDIFFKIDVSDSCPYDVRHIYLRLREHEVVGVGVLAS